MKKTVLALFVPVLVLIGCEREPEIYLYDQATVGIGLPELPELEFGLEVYWDYALSYDVTYDWRAEWHYGWDETDLQVFGEIGYTKPSVFNLRRYYTGSSPYGPHLSVLSDIVNGTQFRGSFNWGFWDILVWNDLATIDGVQSINFYENASLDSVVAYTNQTMFPSRYRSSRYTRAFYEPEPLFCAYERSIEINENLDDFIYDAERGLWVRKLDIVLLPVTYIYLTQVILHNNRGRIAAVDIIGGRLMTFGICDQNGNDISRADEVSDRQAHYMDVTMQFNNGNDSTFVFNVTDQVRKLYKGGVVTVEIDVDTIPIPTRSGGSGFNAVVKDYEDGGTHEFEM